jgi:GNAT superfamily N-acetyltransferase
VDDNVYNDLEWRRDTYVVSTDRSRLDLDVIHEFLREAYWSPGIPREVVERAVAHSLQFGLFAADGAQVGFARAITDRATYAYLADVFVLPAHRGRGLGTWLVGCVLSHPELQGLRRWGLATLDAHGLYARFGFGAPAQPEIHMVIEKEPHDLWPTGDV